MKELIKKMNLHTINVEGNFIISEDQLENFAKMYHKEQLRIGGVGNCKREDTLKHFKEMNELFLEAIIEVENGIYDPIEEFGKKLADKYIIIKK